METTKLIHTQGWGAGRGDGFRRIARSTFRCIGIPLQPTNQTLIKRRLEKTISIVSLRISFFAKQVLRYFSILWFLLLLGDNHPLSHTQKICCEQGPLLGFDTWFNCYNATEVRIDRCVNMWFELLLLWHQGVFWLIRRVPQRLDLVKASCHCWCSLSRSCFLVHLLPSCLSQGRRWWNEALTRDRVIHLLFRLLAEACLPSCCRHCCCCCSFWRHW